MPLCQQLLQAGVLAFQLLDRNPDINLLPEANDLFIRESLLHF
jgi:hypothetical protein